MEAIATIAAAGDVLNISHAAGAGQPDLLLQLTGAEAVAEAFRAHQAAVQQVRGGFLQADSCISRASVFVVLQCGSRSAIRAVHAQLCETVQLVGASLGLQACGDVCPAQPFVSNSISNQPC
jgi:hypothetical protein